MENTRWYTKYTIILAGIILTVYAMVQAAAILKLILFSLFLSLLVIPFCDWLEKHKINRVFAAVMAILSVILLIGGIGAFFYLQLTSLTGNVESLQEPLNELISGLQKFLSEYLGFDGYINFETLKESVYDYLGSNTEALSKWLAGAVSVFTSFFLVPVFMFLILIFRDFLKSGILKIFARKGEKHRLTAETIMNSIKVVIQDYVYGLFIIMIILGFIYSMMLYIIGVDYAFFFGSFAGFLSLIPILGPIIGSLFPAFYALLTMDSLWYPVIIIAASYLIEVIEGNFLSPVILGNQVSLNALAALVFLFIGAQLWGLAGMILFIPIGAILKVMFDEIESLNGFGYLLGRVPPDLFKQSKFARKVVSWFRSED